MKKPETDPEQESGGTHQRLKEYNKCTTSVQHTKKNRRVEHKAYADTPNRKQSRICTICMEKARLCKQKPGVFHKIMELLAGFELATSSSAKG